MSHSFFSNAFNDQIKAKPDADAHSNLYDWQRMAKMKTCSFSDAMKKKRARDRESVLCESLDGLMISKNKSLNLTSAMKKLCLDPVPAAIPCAKTTSIEFGPCVPLAAQDNVDDIKHDVYDQSSRCTVPSCGNDEVVPVSSPDSPKCT